jgi:type IV pilus assembly protein PilX
MTMFSMQLERAHHNLNKRHTRGFVLVISLIFLMTMTLLATSAIKKSTLDEKMAGNLRSQNLAFQAAEHALRFCESAIDFRSGSRTMCQQRNFGIKVTEVSSFPTASHSATAWTDTARTNTAVSMAGVAAQPQCIVDKWNLGLDMAGEKQMPVWVITARGVGSVASSVVVLQQTIRCGSF